MQWPPPARGSRGQRGEPRPTLFLDRDGVLVIDRGYLARARDVELIAGVPEALRRARAHGYRLVGVSNQSGLGRGHFTADDLDGVMRRFTDRLAAAGAPLDAFYYCPHAPQDGCRCRKPAPGLLEEAADRFAWIPERSWVIGDKLSDLDLALQHGLRPVLVLTGHGAEQARLLGDRPPVPVLADLPAAIDHVLTGARP